MYAIVKTGGKQYKVAVGDKLNIEKLDAEVGATVELQAICVVDGANVVADPAEAAKTKVTAEVVEQFGCEVVQYDWQPPAGGDVKLIKILNFLRNVETTGRVYKEIVDP